MKSFVSCLVGACVAALVSSCQSTSKATIHPDYKNLRPESVLVAPTENRTLLTNLRAYPTAGLMQSLITGKGEIDLLAEFSRSGLIVLVDHGYEAQLADESNASSADATLELRILRWDDSTGLRSRGVDFLFEVELKRRDSGESLYSMRSSSRIKSQASSGGPVTVAVIEDAILRAVRRALRNLPNASS